MAIKSLIKPLNDNVLLELVIVPGDDNPFLFKGPRHGKVVAIDSTHSDMLDQFGLEVDVDRPQFAIGDVVIIASKAEVTYIDNDRVLVPDHHIVGVVIPEE